MENVQNNQNKKNSIIAGCGILFLIFIILSIIIGVFGKSSNTNSNKSDETQAAIQANNKNISEQNQRLETQNVEEKEQLKLSISQPENNAELTTDATEIKGKVSDKDARIILTGDARNIKIDSEGNFSLTVNLVKGENKFSFTAQEDDLKAEKSISITRKLTVNEIRKQFKTESKSISYKELFRNIDQYKDRKVYYTGKVVQVMGDGNFLSSMRVEVTRGAYGIWDDVVLATILDAEAPKILEGDIIKFWGTVKGEQTYQTVLGAEITVPEINVEIIELTK